MTYHPTGVAANLYPISHATGGSAKLNAFRLVVRLTPRTYGQSVADTPTPRKRGSGGMAHLGATPKLSQWGGMMLS